MTGADEIRDVQRATWAGLSAGWEKWDSVIMDQLGPVGAAIIGRLGSADTSQFTIGGNGTWKIAWSYSCAGLDPKGSFTVGQDGANSVDGAYITRLGATGRGVTWAYKDAGAHYLAIRTQCRWRITVTS